MCFVVFPLNPLARACTLRAAHFSFPNDATHTPPAHTGRGVFDRNRRFYNKLMGLSVMETICPCASHTYL
jgi:hypothetical protein